MDLKKILKVQNDLELGEDQRPSENSSAVIEKTANDQKLSLELSQEQQQQPEDHPDAKRKCFNEHLKEVSGTAIKEKISSFTCNEMLPAHEQFILNDSGPVSDVATGLQTMNEDCLREICQYLNLFDIVQLGQTCMRLESFAQRVIFPKKAKLIEIEYWPSNGFTIKLDRSYSTKSVTVLTNAIKHLGSFIEDVKLLQYGYTGEISEVWQCIVNVLQDCRNLKTLALDNIEFHSNQLQELIGSFTSLKVLHLITCRGLIRNWSANIKQNFTIEKLSIKSCLIMEKNDDFLEYFKNLSSLDLEIPVFTCSLSRILNHFGHCLKRLKLNSQYGYKSIAAIISKNRTNFEHLEVTLYRDDDIIDFPHLKSVQLAFFEKLINTVLRKLSEQGVIETLEIYSGIFTSKSTNEPPLIFNKLQILKYGSRADLPIFMAMANAHMPALHTVEITAYSVVVWPELLKHVQSKKTIKSIHLELARQEIGWASLVLSKRVIPFEFWSQLIDILREPNREFIHLSISSEQVIEKQSWQLLKDNRHLLKVEQERKRFISNPINV